MGDRLESIRLLDTTRVETHHITLTRPSTVPIYLESKLCEMLKSLCATISPIRVYLKPQIDAFLTESETVHYGIPIDLDVSPQVTSLLGNIDKTLTNLGLREFHQHPNPHVTIATSSKAKEQLSAAHPLVGPPGSQFFSGVQIVREELVDDPLFCTVLQLRVGNSLHTFTLG